MTAQMLHSVHYWCHRIARLLAVWVGLCVPMLSWSAMTVDANTGTVTDTTTGLVWDQCAYGLSGSTCTTGTIFRGSPTEALQQSVNANAARYKGSSDWRVPNKNELESLVKIDSFSPAIDSTAFPATPINRFFWTSTTYAVDPNFTWFVNFDTGATVVDITFSNHVRLVRGGQALASYDFLEPPDTTAPTISQGPAVVGSPTTTTASVRVTTNENSAGYYLVQPAAATAPSATTLTSSGVTVTMIANVAATLDLTGLLSGNSYTLYFVAKDAAGNVQSSPASVTFTMARLPSQLSLSGSSSVQSGGSLVIAASVLYQDGTLKTITPSYSSSNPAVATVSGTGLLTSGNVTTDTTVTITAVYVESGTTVKASKTVTVTAAPATLTGISVAGATSVQSGGQVRLLVTAAYSDTSTRGVTASSWTVSPASLGSVNDRGVLTVGLVTADTDVTVTAQYADGTITKSARLTIRISATAAVLQRLTIIGAKGVLASGETLTLSTEGQYNDGSRKSVLSTWQVQGDAATISATGVLTAKTTTQDTPSLVTASYTEAGITTTGQFLVLIQAQAQVLPIYVEVESTGPKEDAGLSLWTRFDASSIGTPNSDSAAKGARQAPVLPAESARQSYKLYIAALVPGGVLLPSATVFLLNRSQAWQFMGSPLAEYLSGVNDNSYQLVQLFDHIDATLLSGTRIYVGYGVTDQEMIAAGRIRLVYQVP